MKLSNKKIFEFIVMAKDTVNLYPAIFTLIALVMLLQFNSSKIDALIYDFKIKYDVGALDVDDVVVITQDEESDEFLGETFPYTYATHERLVTKLLREMPLGLSYFVPMQTPSTVKDASNLTMFRSSIKEYTKNGGTFLFATDMEPWGERVPPKELRDLGFKLGMLNYDNSIFSKDDVVRRAILNTSGEDTAHLVLANLKRKADGKPGLDSNKIKGSYYSSEADATFALTRLSTSPLSETSRIKKIPFHRVVTGNFKPGTFKDKIVIVGPMYIGNASDYILTAYNKDEYHSSKLLMHALITESLIHHKTVWTVPAGMSDILTVVIILYLSVIIAQLSPKNGIIYALVAAVLVLLISTFLLFTFGIWLAEGKIVMGILLVYYIWVPFKAIGEYRTRYALEEESKMLKKVEKLKQNFISLMSHDLKTPVAKIAGLADNLLQKNKADSELSHDLKLIGDSTKDLNNFISSILDMGKIESDNIAIQLASKDINVVIEQIVKGLKYEANNANVDLTFEQGTLYPIQIDVTLIKRVFHNLIENGIKYAGNGKAVVVKTWDDEKWVYIEVSDNGVGIKPDDIAHIFDKFYRVKNDASHAIKGTGLGLYLVKYFIELHGGTIEANSTVGEGTKFLVKLKNE